MLNTKDVAPNFSLLDQDGATVTLSDFRGQHVLVYFYPKDDTPGCTKESCMIAEIYNDFTKKNVKVIGISKDSPASHKKFANKYNLPFTLLSDPKQEIITRYGADGIIFNKRISFLISPEGIILKIYPKIDPATHALEILNDLDSVSLFV